MKLLTSFLTLIFSIHLAAQDILWAPEFEFSNTKIIGKQLKNFLDQQRGKIDASDLLGKERANYEVLEQLFKMYQSSQSARQFIVEGKFFKEELSSFVIKYPSGFWFEVTVDPGVIEVKAKPTSISDWKSMKKVLNRDLFELFKKNGVTPGWGAGLGAGHLNFDGVLAFGDDIKHYRNFLVDYVNHSELALGLHYGFIDRFNAKPIVSNKKQYAAFIDLIKSVDDGEITKVGDLARKFRSRVLDVHTKEEIEMAKGLKKLHMKNPYKYVAYSGHGKGPRLERGEIRAMRFQNNTEEFIDFAQLYENRIKYLKKKPKLKVLPLNKILERKTFYKRYRSFVEESGLEWKKYYKRLNFFHKCEFLFHKLL